MNPEKLQRTWIAWLLICAVTILIYSGTFSYGILHNYDDDAYFGDPGITRLTADHVKDYFSRDYLGMYQPLPVLSFAVLMKVFPGSVLAHRILQVVLHCLNALLVLILVRRLSGNFRVASLTALLFAVHPMNAESVSWLAARSNLMYAFFYLSALIFYLEWQDKNKGWQWGMMLLCFILSLLSKVTAATFPMAVILLDWFRRKEFSRRTVLLYIPLILLSLVFIRTGIRASGSFGHLTELGQSYSIFERMFLVLQAVWLYLVKSVIPFGQSVIYLFPWKTGGTLPASYFAAGSAACLLIAVLLIAGWRHRNREWGRAIVFWMLFFLVTLSIVLPLKWSRTVLIAERYTYIPYVGLLSMIVTLIFIILRNRSRHLRSVVWAVLGAGILALGWCTWERVKVWKDPVSLFTDVIVKSRSGAEVSTAYYNRGNEYFRLKEDEMAIRDYSEALRIYPGYADAAYNRGLVFYSNGSYTDAIRDFSATIVLQPDNPDAWLNRADAFRAAGKYEEALQDLDHLILVHPDKFAYFNRGALYYFNLGQPDRGCSDWVQALRLGFQPAAAMLEKYCK